MADGLVDILYFVKHTYFSNGAPYCIPANISVRDNIANLAWQASRYFIQLAIIRKLSSRAFQRYMTCLYKPNIGMSYTVGKLLNPAIHLTLFHPARYKLEGSISLYFAVAIISRYTVSLFK